MSEQGVRPRKCWKYQLLVETYAGKQWVTSEAGTYTWAADQATWWDERIKLRAVNALAVRLCEVEP